MAKYAIIDVETTGGTARYERITEIAIAVHDGERVVETFSTLLNPERSIPWNITQLTGITDAMVAQAPKFFEVARRIVELTEEAVFVAHNAAFDYSFIREEFARLGYEYTRRQLCTVRLARKVFPGLPSYSLSNLKRHFGIHADKSHRALDDTLATVQLFEHILAAQEGFRTVRSLVNYGVRETRLPDNISIERLHGVPEACGVYYLHDREGNVIYVGKSLNIRKRLFEHFADVTAKGEKLRAGVDDISYEITGSELVALLLESAEIKRLQPRVNRALRTKSYNGAIYAYTDARGYRRLLPGKRLVKPAPHLELAAEYAKPENARGHLEMLAQEHELCRRLCHIDPRDTACFHYSIKQCHGACIGREPADEYNARVDRVLAQLNRGLTGSFVILDHGRTATERAVVAVHDGQFRGYAFVETDFEPASPSDLLELVRVPGTDPEAGRIIRGFVSGKREVRMVHF